MTILTGTYELFYAIYYIVHVFLIFFYRRRLYLYFHVMFWVLGDMFWICDTWILMSTFFYDLSWFFHNFFGVLCGVLRVSSESDPSRRDRSVSVPAESAAETETLNHGSDQRCYHIWSIYISKIFEDTIMGEYNTLLVINFFPLLLNLRVHLSTFTCLHIFHLHCQNQ